MAEQAFWRRATAPLAGLAGRRRDDDPDPAVLIVTSRHRLWQRYGPDGVFAIERAVGELVAAMADRGLAGTLVYADDSPLLTCLGVLPADTGSPASVARVVRGVAKRVAWTDEQARYVLLLGDDGIVPFHRHENPSPDDEGDLTSDHAFGTGTADSLRPDLAVGRIPDAGLDLLLQALGHAADAHRRLAAGAPLRLTSGAFGYSASVWKRAARGVYGAIGEPAGLRLSPPLMEGDLPLPGDDGPRYRYYNLHGLEDGPNWLGQVDPSFPADYPYFPVALRPEDVTEAPGSVVFSEACFGAHIEGRAVRDSIALSCLAGGALAFVGATGVAYGGLDGPLVAADLLARRFWEALLAGAPAGAALTWAKRRLLDEALARQGYVDAEDEKAVLNFVLYGDPSLVHHVPSVWAEDAAVEVRAKGAVGVAGPASVVGTLPVRPISPADAPAGLAERVHRTVARKLPEFASADVRLTVAHAPRRALAKGPTVRDDIVVTLRRIVPTCSGPSCREVVRVTVDAKGRFTKVAVSR